MIAETGHLALALALALAIAGAILPQVGLARGDRRLAALAGPLALGGLLMVAIAFFALMAGYLTSDFSILNVAANSHTDKPLLYKITGVWGNHEGSLLLWVLVLYLYAAALAVSRGFLDDRLKVRALAVQALIATAFLAFILFTSNPFLRLDPPPIEGRGLNPLLQDPGLAFHPPLLYLGYVGFSVVFALAAAALIEGRAGPTWARATRPFALVAWVALTLGIGLGSWWAYYELGWGGFWFWDPVENASLMPWLAGTALVHSLIVMDKRDALRRWTMLLAIFTFSLSLLGTFLVRSGVLTSVHAFAVDPARGVFILAILGVAIGGALTLFAWRAEHLESEPRFAPVSREGALVINNVLLALAAGVVLVGTLYPLVLDALQGVKITVGPPYFARVFTPIAALLVLLLGIGPHLPWKRAPRVGWRRLVPFGVAGAALALLFVRFVFGTGPALAMAGFGLGGWLAGLSLLDWWRRLRAMPGDGPWRRLRRLPRAQHGMTLAHLGLAVLVFGITAAESFTEERLVMLSPGDTVRLDDLDVRFEGVEPVAGPNYTAIRGRFTAFRQGRVVARLGPEQRTYWSPPMETTEAAIRPFPLGDLYVVIGDPVRDRWSARLYWKPLVGWIWAGALMIAFGGAIALSDRRLRIFAAARGGGRHRHARTETTS